MSDITMHGTTVICVVKGKSVAMGSDGQVTLGNTIMKATAKKVRRVYNNEVLVGFAGATADAITLLDKFESYLEKYSGNVKRASVELAKEWRTNKILRNLEAMMIVASKESQFLISGNGDVIEPEKDGVIAIGSGAPYAKSAALALTKHTKMSAKKLVEESLKIAQSICIYTNNNFTIEEL